MIIKNNSGNNNFKTLLKKAGKFVFSLIFPVLALSLFAQEPVPGKQFPTTSSLSSNWTFTPSVGFTQFYGDISNENFFRKFSGATGFGAGFTARKMFSPVLGAGGNIYYDRIKSRKQILGNGTPVDFSLLGNYFDFNVRGYIDFLNLFSAYDFNRRFSLLGSLGIGYGFWHSDLTDNNTGTTISSGQTVGSRTFKKSGFVVPLGLAGTYRFADNWAVDLGVDFRTVLNDDVDVWHDGYPFDQLLYVKVGVSYFLNYGFGPPRPKIPAQDEECCEEEKPLAPIPVYDYRPRSNRSSEISGGKPEPDVMRNKAPGQPVTVNRPLPQGFEYRVQIMAKAKRREDVNRLQARYHLDYPVEEHFQNGLYLYTVGHFTSYQEALAASKKIAAKGVFDAFVTAYQNGQRVPLTADMKK